ncbi:putative isocitrate dehydrogenase, NAD-dependent [Dictyocaulus viviparus]|uniref:Putative isocitrate dehydrogenase, NAD-dependent n=1 Tax=Dictyocaulus viviparus TaxID=29172 RepID=A0A0D8XZ33_DICVI|nr:putative isocitrate dehydrogenase, NAD-dependent [Dictyocaulus viviparus]
MRTQDIVYSPTMLSRLRITSMRFLTQTSAMEWTKANPKEASNIRTHILPGKRVPLSKYGGRHTVTALPGDGIGPEMINHIRTIFSYCHAPINFEVVQVSSHLVDGDMDSALLAIERNGVAIKDIDIVLIRENTEGEYSGLEHETLPGIIQSIKIVTRPCIERIARMAFEYTTLNNRKKVVEEIAKTEYPHIEFDSMIVDNACMQLVSRPQQFDVMLMPNLYGNIISNIACGLVGGPGLVSGMNIGEKYAVFETGTRNTGTTLAGKDLANPTAFIRASVDMLRYLDCNYHANLISDALWKTLVEQRVHTKDIGGTFKASDVVNMTLENIGSMMAR